MNPTVKLTIEGPPDLVEAVSARINNFFTVTYTSKDRSLPLSPVKVSRFKLVLPPAQAHNITLPPPGGVGGGLAPAPGRETTDSDTPPSGRLGGSP